MFSRCSLVLTFCLYFIVTQFAHSLSFAKPTILNDLPRNMHLATSTGTCQTQLKAYIFAKHFPILNSPKYSSISVVTTSLGLQTMYSQTLILHYCTLRIHQVWRLCTIKVLDWDEVLVQQKQIHHEIFYLVISMYMLCTT